mmetsp:Transcript_40912/g.55735  ORF Transcript_40912/g.55735 Transcript_40912/m.55735 type:complete len:207 (-) Transcript_40912:154-774(-)
MVSTFPLSHPVATVCLGRRALALERGACSRAFGIQCRGSALEVRDLDDAVQLAKTAAAVVIAFRLQVVGLGRDLRHDQLGTELTASGFGAPKLGYKAIKGDRHVLVLVLILVNVVHGSEGRLFAVAPIAPFGHGLVEAGPTGGRAEGFQRLDLARQGHQVELSGADGVRKSSPCRPTFGVLCQCVEAGVQLSRIARARHHGSGSGL